MPAAATAELVQRPKDVKAPDTLSGHAADIWRSAFLSAYSDTCKNRDDRDACAAKIAWSAVKQSYRKNKEGQWVERAADPNVAAVDTGAVDGGAFATPVEPDRPIIPTPQNLTRGEAEVWNRVYLEAVKGACAQQDNPQACAAREAWEAVKAFGEEAELDDEITAEPEDEEEPTEDEEADAEDEAAEGEPADDEEAVDDEEVGDAKESAEADTGEEEAPADAEEEEAEAEPAEEEEPADEETESEEDEEEEDEKDQRRRVRKSLSERSDGLTGKGGTMAPKEQVYTERQMQALIAAGRAMPDGRLPIVSKADVSAAVESFAKANAADPAVIRHIIVRAGSLGALELLPDTWINRGTATMISKVDEQWLKAAVTRIAETLDDLQWLSGIGEDTTITRPTDIPSTVWRTLPAIERSARAEYLRTFVRRMYEQAVDDMRVAGWRAEPMVGRPHEFQFKKFVETGEGPLLVRAILVRKAGTKVWLPREISRGASLSTAVMMLPDELRP